MLYIYKEYTGKNIKRRDFILKFTLELRESYKEIYNKKSARFKRLALYCTKLKKKCQLRKCNNNKPSSRFTKSNFWFMGNVLLKLKRFAYV